MLYDTLLILTLVLGILIFFKIVFYYFIILNQGQSNEQTSTKNISIRDIDIIVPAYNEEKGILRTINSLLEINYDSFKIYVVNDGSTDGTLSLLKKHFDESKTVVIISKANEGKAKALNHAISLSSAELIFFLDADTHVRPDILTIINSCFNQNDIAAVSGHLTVRNITNLLTFSQNVEYLTSLNLEREVLEMVNLFTTIPGATCAFRRKALLKIGCFNSNMATEDCDVTFRLLNVGLKIKNAKNVIGHTEAPWTLRMFIRQRVRWDFGLLQNLLKYACSVSSENEFLRAKIGFIIAYHWLYKIIYYFSFALADFVFLISLFEGFQQVHYYYFYFLIFESVIFIIITIKELRISNLKLTLILIYRILYRHLKFISLSTAAIMFLLGQKNVWKKITRANS